MANSQGRWRWRPRAVIFALVHSHEANLVDIKLQDRIASFQPRGWSRYWSLRRRIIVPLSRIRSVRRAPPDIGQGWWKGWRLPGTHIPGLIVAGSYLSEGDWEFWDVRVGNEQAIEVELAPGERYRRLVVDVENPDSEVERLRAALARAKGHSQPH